MRLPFAAPSRPPRTDRRMLHTQGFTRDAARTVPTLARPGVRPKEPGEPPSAGPQGRFRCPTLDTHQTAAMTRTRPASAPFRCKTLRHAPEWCKSTIPFAGAPHSETRRGNKAHATNPGAMTANPDFGTLSNDVSGLLSLSGGTVNGRRAASLPRLRSPCPSDCIRRRNDSGEADTLTWLFRRHETSARQSQ